MKISRRLGWLGCLALSACIGQNANGGATEMNARALASNAQCAKQQSTSVVEINSNAELNARLPGFSADINAMLKNQRVLVISMGTRPTSGYFLNLAQTRAPLDGKMLTLFVTWHEPAANSILAQVITQPCLVVAVEKGEYNQVRIVDQSGIMRAQLTF